MALLQCSEFTNSGIMRRLRFVCIRVCALSLVQEVPRIILIVIFEMMQIQSMTPTRGACGSRLPYTVRVYGHAPSPITHTAVAVSNSVSSVSTACSSFLERPLCRAPACTDGNIIITTTTTTTTAATNLDHHHQPPGHHHHHHHHHLHLQQQRQRQ